MASAHANLTQTTLVLRNIKGKHHRGASEKRRMQREAWVRHLSRAIDVPYTLCVKEQFPTRTDWPEDYKVGRSFYIDLLIEKHGKPPSLPAKTPEATRLAKAKSAKLRKAYLKSPWGVYCAQRKKKQAARKRKGPSTPDEKGRAWTSETSKKVAARVTQRAHQKGARAMAIRDLKRLGERMRNRLNTKVVQGALPGNGMPIHPETWEPHLRELLTQASDGHERTTLGGKVVCACPCRAGRNCAG